MHAQKQRYWADAFHNNKKIINLFIIVVFSIPNGYCISLSTYHVWWTESYLSVILWEFDKGIALIILDDTNWRSKRNQTKDKHIRYYNTFFWLDFLGIFSC